MTPIEKIDGICNTCTHVGECRIAERSRTEGKPIWHCEAFDDPNLSDMKNREGRNPVVMRSSTLIPGWGPSFPVGGGDFSPRGRSDSEIA